MSSKLLSKAGLKVFEKHLQRYEPADPVYETYTDSKGRTKRRKRDLPPGLSKRDAKVLRKVNKRAHRLDKGFSLCGFRFGWTFVIGIIPAAGDVADATLNYFLVVKKAKEAEIPDWLLRRMLLNNAVSAGMGLVPFVGDIGVAAYKANSRNAALLEEYLRIRGEEYLKSQSQSQSQSQSHAQGQGQRQIEGQGQKQIEEERKEGKLGEEGKLGSIQKRSKSTAATTTSAEGTKMPQEDLDAVKPGAGLQAGEKVPSR